jgi:hypothetical protein
MPPKKKKKKCARNFSMLKVCLIVATGCGTVPVI